MSVSTDYIRIDLAKGLRTPVEMEIYLKKNPHNIFFFKLQ